MHIYNMVYLKKKINKKSQYIALIKINDKITYYYLFIFYTYKQTQPSNRCFRGCCLLPKSGQG